jgi:hypothetical protein
MKFWKKAFTLLFDFLFLMAPSVVSPMEKRIR